MIMDSIKKISKEKANRASTCVIGDHITLDLVTFFIKQISRIVMIMTG